MGNLSIFAFGSPSRSGPEEPFASGTTVYPEVRVEINGSVLSSSFFVTGSLVQYIFPTSVEGIVGNNVKIHYLNDFAYSSNLNGTDTLCFSSNDGLENRALFLGAVILNAGLFSWSLGNFVPAASIITSGFTLIGERAMAIPMDEFTALMGSNVQLKTNSSGILQASVGVLWHNGYVEFNT